MNLTVWSLISSSGYTFNAETVSSQQICQEIETCCLLIGFVWTDTSSDLITSKFDLFQDFPMF